ncbi:MAG TPA: response regulator [Bryobacteraceae bacterium]|jgi:CheY-like chemotaxis protein|nr:response regulator [Bryobacteraceae bacterium]
MAASAMSSLGTGMMRVLVIEDNPADVLLIEEAFSECGYRCELTFANSLSKAEGVIAEHKFHIVLCDCAEREGAARVIGVIRRHQPRVPVIVLSGYPDPHPAYDAGANAFVRKAANLDEFFRRVREIMHFWVEVAELPKS